MSHIRRTGAEIPDPDAGIGDFVDDDNDYVVRSRLDHFVDRSDAISPAMRGRGALGARSIREPSDAGYVWDSEKDQIGNAGIARLDSLRNSESW